MAGQGTGGKPQGAETRVADTPGAETAVRGPDEDTEPGAGTEEAEGAGLQLVQEARSQGSPGQGGGGLVVEECGHLGQGPVEAGQARAQGEGEAGRSPTNSWIGLIC